MKTITQVTLIVFLLSLLVLGIATLLQAQGLLPTDLTLLLTDPTIQLNAVMLSPDTSATASPARDRGRAGWAGGCGRRDRRVDGEGVGILQYRPG